MAYGSLVADAEGLVEARVPLERSERSWVRRLVETKALTDVRPEQSRRLAAGVQGPLRRLLKVLKEKVLGSKLTEARASGRLKGLSSNI